MNKFMVGQNRFSISGLASLSPEGEADQNKHNTSARSRICLVCRDAKRLRVEVPYGNPSFGKSVPCSCVEAQQTALRLQQQRQAAKMDAFRESTFKTFNSSLPGLQEHECLSFTHIFLMWLVRPVITDGIMKQPKIA